VAINKGIAVKILSKDYQIACAEDQVHRVIDASLLLDSKMKEIKASGRVVGLERIAVMAALNLAHELLSQQHANKRAQENTDEHLLLMCDKIEDALSLA
jgi:cell division protein ZapA